MYNFISTRGRIIEKKLLHVLNVNFDPKINNVFLHPVFRIDDYLVNVDSVFLIHSPFPLPHLNFR